MATPTEIVRNPDGSLIVPTDAPRPDADELEATDGDDAVVAGPTHHVLHPGEGGYDEALAQWDEQQHPDRGVAVSTASGREEAMHLLHEVAEEDVPVPVAVHELNDPEASAEALRHVLVGGAPSVKAFATEVAESEGGEPLPPHQATKIIGEVLAEIDT